MATTALPPTTTNTSTSTPPTRSRSSSNRAGLTLDLSDLPPLITPSPPSNTLIITNLNDVSIFHPANLQELKNLINSTAPIHTWSPLKSFRRLIVVFTSTEHAITMKQQLDGTTLFGDRIRVYFGENTNLHAADQHLQAPKSDKLFFISPPPSPPHGWEVRNEEPPNKDVHAEDLALALSRLHARPVNNEPESPTSPTGMEGVEAVTINTRSTPLTGRSRSATLVYHPEDHGDSPDLPCIAVEDTSDQEDGSASPMEGVERKFSRTERPPVELMH